MVGFAFAILIPPPRVFAQIGCGTILTTSTTLTSDIGPCVGPGLILGSNGITLDCAGRTVTGSATAEIGSSGIDLSGRTGDAVKNCTVSSFHDGFLLSGSTSNTLSGNTASGNTHDGFNIASSSTKNTLTGNTAGTFNGNCGIDLSSSNSNTFMSNTANSNVVAGFCLSSSNSNTLTRNTAKVNPSGFLLSSSSSNTLTGNTANDNTGTSTSPGAGFYLVSFSSMNVLRTNAAVGNVGNSGDDGFHLDMTTSSNSIIGNQANFNPAYGYEDNSLGSRTSGTANTYSGDRCTGNGLFGSLPSGLCR